MCQSDYALKVEIMYIERFWIMEGSTKVLRSQQGKTDPEGISLFQALRIVCLTRKWKEHESIDERMIVRFSHHFLLNYCTIILKPEKGGLHKIKLFL